MKNGGDFAKICPIKYHNHTIIIDWGRYENHQKNKHFIEQTAWKLNNLP